MKKSKIIIITLFISTAFFLASCGEEDSALKDAYNAMQNEGLFGTVNYIEDMDAITINIEDAAQGNNAIDKLNEYIKDKNVGRIYFEMINNDNSEDAASISQKIGQLECKSMKVLGIGYRLSGNLGWTAVISKVGVVCFDEIPDLTARDLKGTSNEIQKLKSIERMAIYGADLTGIDEYKNLKEIWIEESAAFEERQEDSVYTFSVDFVTPSASIEDSSLEKLLIAPELDNYEAEEYGESYLFCLSLLKPDLLVNRPGSKVEFDENGNAKEDSLTKVSELEFSKPNSELLDDYRHAAFEAILLKEAKKSYKKAVKLDTKKGKPTIKGKSLIAFVKYPHSAYAGDYKKLYLPDSIAWPDYDDGHPDGEWEYERKVSILLSERYVGKLPVPEKSRDYDNLIYIYPTYRAVGSYTGEGGASSMAYSETYYCQVFDLKKKIAYEPQHIASAQPNQNENYSGSSAPVYYAASVDRDVIYSFLKKLKAN